MKHTKSSRLGGLIKKTSLALIAGAFILSTSIAQADIKPAVVYDIAGMNDKSFNESVFNGSCHHMPDCRSHWSILCIYQQYFYK